jgi:hypothetical protein
MYIDLHVKYRYYFYILMNLEFSRQVSQISNLMKIRPVEVALFQADGRTDRKTDRQTDRHDNVNSRFSKFCEGA